MSSLSPARIAAHLSGQLRGRVRADQLALAMYSTDASIYQIEPLCVTMPTDAEDIAAVVRFGQENNIPIIARGAGSGLAGESIGAGIIMDLSVAMNRVLTIDADNNRVTVQPGVVLEVLNQQLAPLGKQIGPDPASGNRATLGGMIGNNSTGAHSVKYGYIGQHLQEVKVIAADGTATTLRRSHDPSQNGDRAGQWAQDIYAVLNPARELMARVKPKSDRNGSGYNVFHALEDDRVNLAELIAGSEGTLAVVTEATLGLVDVPKFKGLLQVNFDTMPAMARAVPMIMAKEPSACELMDGRLLGMARDAYPHYHDVLPDVAASLIIEVTGQEQAELDYQLSEMQKLLENLPQDARPISIKNIVDPSVRARIWAARKAAVPLLFRTKSAAQPIPVVEDVAVPPEALGDYVAGLEEITQRLDVPMAYYAHAGHGEMHPRPFLNLHDENDVKKLRQLAEETFQLAWKLGGTISGEHGEGLVRAAFIKPQYGDDMYNIFRQIKQTFDPQGIINPGKIINDDPDIMTKNLRFARSPQHRRRQTALVWRDNELAVEAEQCNGNGLCRSQDSLLSMCPIFRASGDEDASPRAKGNLMRHWITGNLPEDIMQSPEFKKVADLCVNCKMCAMQCPSLVNIPKMMMEARAEYVQRHGLTRTQMMLTRSELMSKMGATFGPIANFFLQSGWFCRILETVGGLDHRRPMPAFEWGNNISKLRQHLAGLPKIAEPTAKVAYFVDLYATYNDHELGRAVVDILRHHDIDVIIPKQREVGMPAISYGDLKLARKTITYNVQHLAEAVRQGYTIVASEPTAALCLKEEYLDVVDSADAKLVAENTMEFTEYLGTLLTKDQLKPATQTVDMTLAYHEPCHYGYMKIEHGTLELLKRIEGITVEELPNSCCGIAGTFGFQKKNYDLSMKAGEPMLKPLRDSHADYGLTECGTCKMQMQQGSDKQVLHPAKIIARSYGLL